ncbi:hypothetical protein HUU05_07065 [candidate division KSB1 bacterium]|nr:hypothetical protein [candidate division KSB1 bacterium]
MNLGQKLVTELSTRQPWLNKSSPAAIATHEQTVDGIHFTIEMQDADKYGFLVRSISAQTLEHPRAELALQTLLTRQAAEIEKRLTYLLEHFRLVELDELKQIAQVRSHVPYRQDGTVHYYEILLTEGASLSFVRCNNSGARGQREIEPTYITKEALTRLANDFIGVLHVSGLRK